MFTKSTVFGIIVALSSMLTASANHLITETDTSAAAKEYADLIGVCDCQSLSRNNTGQWGDTTKLIWKWEYIMDGKAVQDTGEYYNGNELQSFTSIRVFDDQNKQWYVSYFTPNLTAPPKTWVGGKDKDRIILTREDEGPGGKTLSTLTFSKITEQGFTWEGTSTHLSTGNTYTFWEIWCKKRKP